MCIYTKPNKPNIIRIDWRVFVCVETKLGHPSLPPPLPSPPSSESPKHLDWGEGHTYRAHRGNQGFVSVPFDPWSPSITWEEWQEREGGLTHPSSFKERRTCVRCLSSLPLSLHLLPCCTFTLLLPPSHPSYLSCLHSELLLPVSLYILIFLSQSDIYTTRTCRVNA